MLQLLMIITAKRPRKGLALPLHFSVGSKVIHRAKGDEAKVLLQLYIWLSFIHTIGDITISGGVTLSGNTLTCISTGGPATTVTWTRDSVIATEGTQTVLDDPVTAQYTHTLAVTGRLGELYTCIVANSKPSQDSATYQCIL